MKHPIIGNQAFEDVRGIMRSGKLSGYLAKKEYEDGGEWVQRLESAVREYTGSKYAMVVNSATSALHLACIASGIKKGDYVAVSPFTMSASVACVMMCGGIPVFVDIEPDYFCMDMEKLAWICKKLPIKAVIPVDLAGNPCNATSLANVSFRYDLKVIEDAAQSIGSAYLSFKCGTLGDIGILSFNQHKNVTCGEGGVVLTDNDEIARKIKALRNHAESSDPELGMYGFNMRMCEIEAAIVLEQFQRLDEINKHRNLLCERMNSLLPEGIIAPKVREGCYHSYFTYNILYERDDMSRDDFQKALYDRGIYFGLGYMKPLYYLPAFKDALIPYKCDVVEKTYKKMLFTDIFRPPMTLEDVDKIGEQMRDILGE